MKVLFLITSLNKGGAEKVLSNITMNLPQSYDIDILVNNDEIIDYKYRGNIITLGFGSKKHTDSVIFQFIVLLRRICVLKKLKKKNTYVACISFMDSANIANIISGNKYCKTILTVHASLKAFENKWQYKYVVNPLVRLFYNMADTIVAVSEELRGELIEQFNLRLDKTFSIVNGCNVDEIDKLKLEKVDDKIARRIDGKRVIISVGRLTEQKRQWNLIHSFNKVVERIPDAILLIAGAGELEGKLKRLTNNLGLNNSVIFLGFQKNIYKYLNVSEVFVLASGWEGFPVSLAEAICVGVPCVATDFRTGAREILSPNLVSSKEKVEKTVFGDFGIIVPMCSRSMGDMKKEDDIGEMMLADAICSLLQDRNLNEKYRCSSIQMRDKLHINTIISQWEELINE